MFGQDRDQLRDMYYLVWDKYKTQQTLEPLEKVLLQAMLLHPEYHAVLDHRDKNIDKNFSPKNQEVNPFLHLGFHVAIFEQLDSNRPLGIRESYQKLLDTHKDQHTVQHMLIDCLVDMITKMQRDGNLPDEQAYLSCVRGLK